MTNATHPPSVDTATRVACLERLATALSRCRDLDVAVQADGPAPCVAIRNTVIPFMSETVGVGCIGDRLVFTWSWGQRIADAAEPGAAAHAIAYVLKVRGEGLDVPSQAGQKLAGRERAGR